MAQFSVNANLQRFDPYNNFKFLVKWDGKYVAGVSKVTALKRSTKPAEHREVETIAQTESLREGRHTMQSLWKRGVTHEFSQEGY